MFMIENHVFEPDQGNILIPQVQFYLYMGMFIQYDIFPSVL